MKSQVLSLFTCVGQRISYDFVILGAVICYLYFAEKREGRTFSLMWLYILLSFLFYIPVAVFAGLVPMLGMLMLPKTICYILMIVAFLKNMNEIRKRNGLQ